VHGNASLTGICCARLVPLCCSDARTRSPGLVLRPVRAVKLGGPNLGPPWSSGNTARAAIQGTLQCALGIYTSATLYYKRSWSIDVPVARARSLFAPVRPVVHLTSWPSAAAHS
jgi:hypothetical protein